MTVDTSAISTVHVGIIFNFLKVDKVLYLSPVDTNIGYE